MKPIYQEPTVTHKDGPMSGDTYEHPAYGQISASRVSGNINLYGSEFTHHNFISISVKKSQTTRSLSHDWLHARDEIVEVLLSEAQWATFVSSMNVGSGVPCTINAIHGTDIPEIPPPAPKQNQFSNEVSATMADALVRVKSLEKKLLELTLSKKAQEELIGIAKMIERDISGSVDFVSKSFDEHMEKVAEKAKVEVNAYMTNAIQRAGIEALNNQNNPLSLSQSNNDQS